MILRLLLIIALVLAFQSYSHSKVGEQRSPDLDGASIQAEDKLKKVMMEVAMVKDIQCAQVYLESFKPLLISNMSFGQNVDKALTDLAGIIKVDCN